MSEFKFALRQLFARPTLSAVIVLTLALGIGATTAMFSLYHALLLQPLPAVAEPERLVNLTSPGDRWGMVTCTNAGGCAGAFSYPMYQDLRAGQDVFTDIAAHRNFSAALAFDGRTLAGQGMLVSGGYFGVLGMRPALGRLIDGSDEPRVDESAVVVLSHELWQGQFGGDPGVIGRELVVNGVSMTIVGVAAPGFTGTTLGVRAQVFVPITMAWALQPTFPRVAESRTAYWVYMFARLRPGVTIDGAAARANALYSALMHERDAPANSGMPPNVLENFLARQLVLSPGDRGQSSFPEAAQTPLTLLLGVTALVLLIACVNIANLLLARGAARAGELAVRASVGASGGRLARQLMTEAIVLAAAGFILAIPAALLTLNIVVAMLPQQMSTSLVLELSWAAIAFAGVAALGTTLLFGAVPAWQASRTDPGTVLKGVAGQPGGGRGMARFRSTLATTQIAFSMLLLVLAGLFTSSLANVSRVELGLQTDNVVTFSASPRLSGYSRERSMDFFDRLETELAALPGVVAAAGSQVPLLTNNTWANSMTVEGFESEPGADTNALFNNIGPDYFAALGIPILRGRAFTDADRADTPRVAVVNEAFVRKFNLGDDAVGKRIGTGGQGDARDIEIVGVVADAKYSEVKEETIAAQYFTPWRQNANLGGMNFYVRTSIGTDDLMAAIPRVVASLDPQLPVGGLTTFEMRVQENVYLDRMVSVLAGGFAALATLLAAIGLYGVLAYGVAQRTREIGLRLALGAAPSNLSGMVLKQVGRMGVVGGVIGLVGAVFVGRYAETLLFGLSARDPEVLGIAAVLLAVVVATAGYLPARRASRVAPMEALRYE